MPNPYAPTDPKITGEPPHLAGFRCTGLLCQAFLNDGDLIEDANVTHLQFGNTWYRLNIDDGVIFSKRSDHAPGAWAAEEEGWKYPLADVGDLAGVIGALLSHYEMTTTSNDAQVVFVCENGRTIVIDNADGRSSYRIS